MLYNRPFFFATTLLSALVLLTSPGAIFATSADHDLESVTEHLLSQASDPAGDTSPGYGPEFDIRTVRGFQYENTVALLVSTHGNHPFLDGDAEPYFVVPRFDIDTDQNSSTGFEATGDFLGIGNSGIGTDYYVDFLVFDPATASVPVYNAADVLTGTASVFTASIPLGTGLGSENFVFVEIPLAALGNDDGRLDFTVTMGEPGGFSDTAPDVGFVTTSLESEILLQDGRFLVTVDWETAAGGTGVALPVNTSTDSVLLYFFFESNWELIVKVIDACSFTGSFWVFSGGATDVGFTLTVEDLETGVSRIWENPVGSPAPVIRDTQAFLTCDGV